MSDVYSFRYDQMEEGIFMNILSIEYPQDSSYAPFIIIKMQMGTVSLCTLSRRSSATSIANDSILNKDVVFLFLLCKLFLVSFSPQLLTSVFSVTTLQPQNLKAMEEATPGPLEIKKELYFL